MLDDNKDIGDTALTLLVEEEVNRRILALLEELLLMGGSNIQNHANDPANAHHAVIDALTRSLEGNYSFQLAIARIIGCVMRDNADDKSGLGASWYSSSTAMKASTWRRDEEVDEARAYSYVRGY